MEILQKEQYKEFEDFVQSHPNGSITQSTYWHDVKSNWGHEIVVLRDDNGKIYAGVSVLIRKIPVVGTTMLYAPRGPVCDYNNKDELEQLQKGIDILAKKYKAHIYKMDPDVNVGESEIGQIAEDMGYKRFYGDDGFETIQARFNFRMYIDGRDEKEVLMDMNSKTRYNVRLAGRRGVTVEVADMSKLDEFMDLMKITGERDNFTIRSKEYFEIFMNGLKEHARLYMAYYEDEPVAGAIATNYAGKTCYIYGASDNDSRNVMPTYLIQWEMIKWAIETGCTVYDFQGISGDLSEDNPLYGLYRFKRGFSGQIDELVGEFDYVYKPFANKMVDIALAANEKMKALKRKMG